MISFCQRLQRNVQLCALAAQKYTVLSSADMLDISRNTYFVACPDRANRDLNFPSREIDSYVSIPISSKEPPLLFC